MAQKLLEHQAGEELRLGELLGAELVPIRRQGLAGRLSGDPQDGVRGFAGLHIPTTRPNQTRFAGFLQSVLDFFSVHPVEAPGGLKKADMLIPLGVALQDSKPGGQHVHQPVVSRVRRSRLSVRSHSLHRGTGRSSRIRQEPKTCRCAACGSARRRLAWSRPTAVPFPAHRPTHATFLVLPIPRVECRACGVVRQVDVAFADSRRSYTRGLPSGTCWNSPEG